MIKNIAFINHPSTNLDGAVKLGVRVQELVNDKNFDFLFKTFGYRINT